MNFDDKEKILQAFDRKSKSFQGSKNQQDSALFTSDIQGQETVDTKHPAGNVHNSIAQDRKQLETTCQLTTE